MIYRRIRLSDITEVFKIRLATDENIFTYDELVNHGITYQTVREKLKTTAKGWICEIDKKAVGFAIADRESSELWLIAVLPEYINQKIGTKLYQLAETWLISSGCKKIQLITDPDRYLRAYSFYIKHGWKETKIENGILHMEKLIE